MIEIENVTKRFYTLTAIDGVTMTIPVGEVIGLLGPNGAGKTTLFKLVAGVLKPNDGRIYPTGSAWPKIGLKTDRLLFPNHLRVGQYLKLVAGISNLEPGSAEAAVIESLRQVDLLNAISKKISQCSKGMRQRLGLAQVLIGDPPLVLLDEPSSGLDPDGQADILQRIKMLQAAGKTVMMSSHLLHEVTEVCTQLVILNQGQIHYQNSMANALATRKHIYIKTAQPLADVCHLFQDLHQGILIEGDTITLEGEAMRLGRQVLSMLLQMDKDVIHVEQKRTTLAEIYAEAVQ